MVVYQEASALERDMGIPLRTLYRLSNNIGAHYTVREIPKAGGGVRRLSVPDEALKAVQRTIAECLLAPLPVSVYATAYRPGGGVRTNAACHVGRKKLLKLDIYHFFDSIRYSTVKEKAFPKGRYPERLRILLSMLCYHGEALPQGAPTSPVISNIIMREFDEDVADFCRPRAVLYTRYCDDMTFSGDFDEKEIVDFVSNRLKPLGFILNEKKTRLLTDGCRKTVTGAVVNDKLNTKKEYRRALRQALYYCKKFGVAEHLCHIGIADGEHRYLLGLLGKVNYVLQLTPDDPEFLQYREELRSLIKKSPI